MQTRCVFFEVRPECINIIQTGFEFKEFRPSSLYNNKAQAVPQHAMEGLGGGDYSSYSFLTSALDGGEWSAAHPDRTLAPGNGPRYPLDRLGRP
jgi:hypothetical protein